MALEGRTAVVTGAAQGIGRSISEILLKNGAKVALLDVAEATGTTLKKSLDGQYGPERTLFIPCDVQSHQQFKAALQKVVETFGHLDIFCNNAGIANENDWEKTVSINLMGVVRGSYLALEHMNKLSGGQGGVIINIASLAGLGPLPGAPIYTATKHGVVGFTRAMADKTHFIPCNSGSGKIIQLRWQPATSLKKSKQILTVGVLYVRYFWT
ncbi:15-hydroxyprostaglandin dehydrogenase [NAD(+)]-like isoform X2 [Gadus chalcogrammus]|uniref:15-hydroxyprostaglandin dehydrogenase [NAD(+)]-like isoform X2 n=1 Tax=Gadus chalcogrammus TaxID=1042646 RepID=UPI0024C32B55|nr:15-hydroxyprostaglandin dehydrogenase [NAD(+)]-like isoform X2 [Gadus chalcogrammus]